MSAERAGRLRDAYERVSREDIDGFLTVVHPDVEWTEQVLPDPKVYRGHDGVRSTITALFDRDEALRAAGLG